MIAGYHVTHYVLYQVIESHLFVYVIDCCLVDIKSSSGGNVRNSREEMNSRNTGTFLKEMAIWDRVI